MSNVHLYRRYTYMIIIAGILLSIIISILPHYNQSHRLVLDVLLLGLLPYVLYSLFIALEIKRFTVLAGLIILSADIFFRLPAWWNMQTRTIPDQLYYIPVITSIMIIPAAFLLYWMMRKK